jgi:subtilisin family serine protease
VTSSSFVGALESFEPVEGNLVTAGLGRPEDFVSTKVFENRIVLIQRGEIPFADKVKNAIKAKAKAVLIYNNTSGLLSGALTQDGSTLPITAAMIEQNVGEDLARKIDILQKPVKASLKIAKTDYAAFQGTSMATPHVSGVVALILSANPKLNTKQVRDLLKSTAFKLESCNNNENQCGAGLVNSLAAVKKAKTLKDINQDNSWGVATP